MLPNSQLARLADNETRLKSLGEISITFTRNNFSMIYRSLVFEKLHTDLIGGTTFIKDNKIIQDFDSDTITIHKKYVVFPTINLPRQSISPQLENHVIKINTCQILLPGQEFSIEVPHPNQSFLSVEPFSSEDAKWPNPQIVEVKNNAINLKNNYSKPIRLGKETKLLQLRSTTEILEPQPRKDYKYTQQLKIGKDCTNEIKIHSENLSQAQFSLILEIHRKYASVFNQDLSNGYNHNAGTHFCRLNFSDQSRPRNRKI